MFSKFKAGLVAIAILLFAQHLSAQTAAYTIIEGSRTLVELIKVFRTPRQQVVGDRRAGNGSNSNSLSIDSCEIKQRSDLCYSNKSSRSLIITIYKRTEEGYEAQPFTMKVLSQKEECWFEMRAGIYKYRIELDATPTRVLLREGEFKLEACENMKREISD